MKNGNKACNDITHNTQVTEMRPYCPKCVALILGHNIECDDFRSAGFHQNHELQALFSSKTLLLMDKCDVL